MYILLSMTLLTFPVVLYFSDLYLGEEIQTLDESVHIWCIFGGGSRPHHKTLLYKDDIHHGYTCKIRQFRRLYSIMTGGQRSDVFTQ